MAIRKREVSTAEAAQLALLDEDIIDAKMHDHRKYITPRLVANNVPLQMALAVTRKVAWSGGYPVPKQMEVQDLLDLVRLCDNGDNIEKAYRERIRSPLTGVRAYCVFCAGGSPRGATNCDNTQCSLWAFRTGKNPFYNFAAKIGNEEASI